MTVNQKIIVITDLDGTLLDHNDYSYIAASPALKRLKQQDVPLIFNSSKTAAELVELRRVFDNKEPFVVENGGGIYVPDNSGGHEKISFGIGRQTILSVLRQLRNDARLFVGFSDMDAAEIAECTGLSIEQAEQAMQREFSEPIVWKGDESGRQNFCTELAQHSLISIKGGRFMHISGAINKGEAVRWLREYYKKRYNDEPLIIALGDSENDKQMLECADFPVIIRSPVQELPDVKADNLLISDDSGPSGWNACVMKLLDLLNQEHE